MAIYDGEQGKTLPLKEFMLNHVTSYEPGIFLGLVDDWPAIEKWNLESENGEETIVKEFGEELI